MAATYLSGVIQIVATYDVALPRTCANVTYWQAGGSGFTTTQLTAMQTAFNTKWPALWAGYAVTNTHYTGCIVTDMSSNTGASVGNVGYTPIAGGQTGFAISDGSAALISLHTAKRYRGGHGRIYLPGIAVGVLNNDGRTIQDSFLTGAVTAYNQLASTMGAISGTNGGPLTHVVWHKHLASSPNTTEVVTGITAQPLLATQRRRLRKVSRHRRP